MLIAITGGIGSGKSVVSQILRILGYPVYDCDSRARTIMDSDCGIHRRLCEQIHPQAVVGGIVDRQLISSIVFNDTEALTRLNTIVHGAVTADLMTWSAAESTSGHPLQFVETAIPVQSGLCHRVDAIWQVTAPESLRIVRVQRRSGLSPDQIRARIEAQRSESLDGTAHADIINDGNTPILPQIHRLLDQISSTSVR